LIVEHQEAQLAHYGREIGLRTMRKHLSWYLARLGALGALRAQLMRADTPEAVAALLRDGLEETTEQMAA
ncbi:MAG: tRNA dihydrouridine synthase DusB, partial [Pseudomonadota bacterium]